MTWAGSCNNTVNYVTVHLWIVKPHDDAIMSVQGLHCQGCGSSVIYLGEFPRNTLVVFCTATADVAQTVGQTNTLCSSVQ